MIHTIVKSGRPFHTIIICNIKSPPCTKLEILDFAQKLPGHAQIKEVQQKPQKFRTDQKFSINR